MSGRAFVDTNLLVYTHDAADPEKRRRARATLADAAPGSLVLSSQVLSEFYVTVTRKLAEPLSEADAAVAVRSLAELPVVSVDEHLVLRGIDIRTRWQTSYWDALIVAAAESAGCERILSEDFATGATIAGITVENPLA